MILSFFHYPLKNDLLVLLKLFSCSFLLILSPTGYAQLCTGNLSEPIISIDFGERGTNGPDYGPPLPAGQTTYTYLAGAINDGQYTISHNTNLGRPEWHNSTDHTPDDNDGYMFVVNAALTANEFFRDRVTGLCENTLFEFSAWVLNALPEPGPCSPNSIPPDVKFQIFNTSGSLLAEISTGDIAGATTPGWQQFGLTFVTQTGQTEIDLVMVNNGNGGCGNDLAIDDIEVRACGDIAFTTSTLPVDGICEGSASEATMSVDLTGGVYDSPVFQWQRSTDGGNSWHDLVGETNANLFVATLINGYRYRFKVAETLSNLQNGNCSVISDDFEVIIYDLPVISLNIPNPICETDDVEITINSDKTLQMAEWLLPDGSTIDNLTLNLNGVTPTNSGNYNVTATDTDGCTATDFFSITVNDTSIVMLPLVNVCIDDVITLPDDSQLVIEKDTLITTLFTNWFGCDSTVITDVVANPVYDHTIDTIVCRGSTLWLPDGTELTITDDLELILSDTTSQGCDSIVTKNITVPDTTFLNESLCIGDKYLLPDQTPLMIEKDTVITQVLVAQSHPCDSIVEVTITASPSYQFPPEFHFGCPLRPYTLPNGLEVTENGTYYDSLKTVAGCDSVYTYIVEFGNDYCQYEDYCSIRLPSAFSPNGNALNESFGPIIPPFCRYKNYELIIFNRWGNKVFTSTNPFVRWQGIYKNKASLQGLYLYHLEYTLILEDDSTKDFEHSEAVILLR